MKRNLPAVGVCAALTLAVALLVVAFWPNGIVSLTSKTANAKQTNPAVIRALSALETSPEIVVRVQAARTVAATEASLTSDEIARLGNRLLADSTAIVRSEIATSFARVANTQNEGNIWIGPNEEQMLRTLRAAYDRETDVLVKVSIIRSASAFNHEDALALIDEAAKSNDPAVADAATAAKQLVANRRILQTAGKPSLQNPWK